MFWNGLFGIVIEAYMEFLVSSALNFTAPSSDQFGELISKYVSWFCTAMTLVICPMAFYYVFKLPIQKLSDEHFERKWGALYEGIQLKNKWQAAYYAVFCGRRVLFVMTAFFITNNPC